MTEDEKLVAAERLLKGLEGVVDEGIASLDFETLKDVYEGIMRPRELTNKGLWQLRHWDGMDGTWIDIGGAQTPHEALKEWFRRTDGGDKNISFNEIDYYRIFPAATTMKWGDGKEMFRGDSPAPEPPPQQIIKSKKKRRNWDDVFARQFTNALEGALSKVGWHVGMTGSVLFNGASNKDLDLIVYPHTTENTDLEVPRGVLRDYSMKLTVPVEKVHERWRSIGSKDSKHVEVWTFHHLRIDILFLR